MEPKKRLYVRGKDWTSNIPVTRVVREDSVIWAYDGNNLIGMFDLGEIICFYVSPFERNGQRNERGV